MNLVSGATGLVGSYIISDLLKAGQMVRGLCREQSDKSWTYRVLEAKLGAEYEKLSQNLTWAKADLKDIYLLSDALESVERVFHCAAMVSFQRSDQAALYEANVEGTKNLVNAILSVDRDIQLCHISSTSAIGKGSGPISVESDQFAKNERHSYYGYTKYLAELEVERGREEGLNSAILNPSVILGFTNPDRGSGKLYGSIKKGMRFFSSGASGVVGAEDVSRAAILLLKNDCFEGRYICVNENMSFKQIMESVAHSIGMKGPSVGTPDWLVKTAGRLGDVLDRIRIGLPISTEIAHSSIAHSAFSNSKLRAVANFKFAPLSEIIRNTGDMYKSYWANI